MTTGEIKLSVLPLSSIEVGERFRKDYGDLDEFKHELQTNGLLQPIAVMEQGEGYYLCAGGRRLRAATELGWPTIPALILPHSLDELGQRTVELAENLYRKNLTYEEEAALISEIHRLQLDKHGPKVNLVSGEGWSQTDTANLLGVSKQKLSEELELAHALEEAPELFEECKNRSDALKTLQKAKEHIVREELSRRVEAQIGAGTLDKERERLVKNYLIGDFLEGVRNVRENVFDLVEFDPPYNITLEHAVKTLTDKQAKDLMSPGFASREEYLSFLTSAVRECFRVLKPNAWMLMWFPPYPYMEPVREILEGAGFRTPDMPALWNKVKGVTRQHDILLGASYEMFFYARKGNPVLVKRGRSNVFTYTGVQGEKKTHPTERPLDMMQDILETFAVEGSMVLVPCLGSGATLLAASNAKMQAIGWDKSPDYRPAYVERVQRGQPGGYQ